MGRRLSIAPQRFSLRLAALAAAALLPLGIVTAAPAQAASSVNVWVDLHMTCKNAETRTSIDTGETAKWATFSAERNVLRNVPYGYTSSTLRWQVQILTTVTSQPATFTKSCKAGGTTTWSKAVTVTIKPVSGAVYSG